MLTLTDTATTVVKSIVSQNATADDSGLRIKGGETGTDLTAAVVPAPEPGDAVVDAEGARVFLDNTASAALDDKVLDAQVTDQGAVTFAIAQQA